MQLNEVACILATACKDEEKNFDLRTCTESRNPPFKWRRIIVLEARKQWLYFVSQQQFHLYTFKLW